MTGDINTAIAKLQSANNALLQAFCEIPFPAARMRIAEAQRPVIDALSILHELVAQQQQLSE